ncbi:hypothetical protein MPL3356_60589 [Mesorhizobium plurifarium]|uniref:Uncharacterized protein n=1 Tax=Mesorhizobium plurifarium TaxID=69974 RepID=A0A090G7B9_MESPL|nr:hypothetical protein MPL3356_60589 [Mesorhizobium plurifarium]
MARPKGSKNKPKLAPVAPPGGRPGDNRTVEAISDDQLQALTRQLAQKRAKLVAEEKTAKANRMNHDRLIKTELGEHGLKEIKLLEELETPEGEKEFKARRERELRVARWAGLPVGSQGEFDLDRRPIAEKAFEDGKRAGMKGEDCKPPHAPGTEAFDKWIEGWHEGQAILAAGFKQKPADPGAPELLREEGKDQSDKPDVFDEAASGQTAGAGAADVAGDEKWPDDTDIEAQKTAEAATA